MGTIIHNAIVMTAHRDSLPAVVAKARECGLQVIGPSEPVVNGYASAMVCPDGSKEGWGDSDAGNERREEFRAWLIKNDPCEWVEVAFGYGLGHVSVVGGSDVVYLR